MGTFWAVIIAVAFIAAVGVLIALGVRYLSEERRGAKAGEKLDSSADKRERDRREHELESGERSGGRTRVYRH